MDSDSKTTQPVANATSSVAAAAAAKPIGVPKPPVSTAVNDDDDEEEEGEENQPHDSDLLPVDRFPTSSSHPNDQVVAVYVPAPYAPDSALESQRIGAEAEIKELQEQKRSQQATSEHVTPEMVADAQHLLTLFGCPYLISPAEAEAQCAVLHSLSLVDGVVTDDSDVFLFSGSLRGGHNTGGSGDASGSGSGQPPPAIIYRHMFEDQKKFVEKYHSNTLYTDLGLDRCRLIALAMLLGSDYTVGVTGIGIVNAMEIVNAFGIGSITPDAAGSGGGSGGGGGSNSDAEAAAASIESGLVAFRKWCYSGSVDRKPKPPDANEEWFTLSTSERAALQSAFRLSSFKYKHRHARAKWAVPSTFPESAVIRAYLLPVADFSTEPVTWAQPDRAGLVQFCGMKFGWTETQTLTTLEPVLTACADTTTQAKLDVYVSGARTCTFALCFFRWR